MKVVALKERLDSLLQQASYAKVMTPLRKEWDPEIWGRVAG